MIVEGSAREPVIVVAIGSNNCSEAVVGKGIDYEWCMLASVVRDIEHVIVPYRSSSVVKALGRTVVYSQSFR